MNTTPRRLGASHARIRINKKPVSTQCSNANVNNVLIPISDVVASRECGTQRVFLIGVNVGVPHGAPGGSPFQLPTRLADGLGLESDLGHRCRRPFAPPRTGCPGIWVPRANSQEGEPA